MNFQEKLKELIDKSMNECKNDRDFQLLASLKELSDFSFLPNLPNEKKEIILDLVLVPNLKFDINGEPIEDTIFIEKIIDELSIDYF